MAEVLKENEQLKTRIMELEIQLKQVTIWFQDQYLQHRNQVVQMPHFPRSVLHFEL